MTVQRPLAPVGEVLSARGSLPRALVTARRLLARLPVVVVAGLVLAGRPSPALGGPPDAADPVAKAKALFEANDYTEYLYLHGMGVECAEALAEFLPPAALDKKTVAGFLEIVDYVAIDATGTGGWAELGAKMRPDHTQAFYFSVAPALFGEIDLIRRVGLDALPVAARYM